jgi:hypothetical protein
MKKARKLDALAAPAPSHGRHSRRVERRGPRAGTCPQQGPRPTDHAARLVGGHHMNSPGPRALCPEQAIQGGTEKEKHKLVRGSC